MDLIQHRHSRCGRTRELQLDLIQRRHRTHPPIQNGVLLYLATYLAIAFHPPGLGLYAWTSAIGGARRRDGAANPSRLGFKALTIDYVAASYTCACAASPATALHSFLRTQAKNTAGKDRRRTRKDGLGKDFAHGYLRKGGPRKRDGGNLGEGREVCWTEKFRFFHL